jgi:hypothetical protein
MFEKVLEYLIYISKCYVFWKILAHVLMETDEAVLEPLVVATKMHIADAVNFLL